MSIRHLLGVITAVCALLPSLAMAEEPAPISTATFFRRPLFSNVQISPDGKHLAVIGPVKGDDSQTQLDFLDLSNMQVIGNYTFSGTTEAQWLTWITDNKIIYTTSERTGTLDRPYSTYVLFKMDMDGKNIEGFAGCSEVQATYPGASGKAVIEQCGAHPTAGVAEFADDESPHKYWPHRYLTNTREPPIEYGYVWMDNAMNSRVADGLHTLTFKQEMYYLHSAKDKDWHDLSQVVASEPRFAAYGPVMFTPDDAQFYYKGQTPAGTLGLYTVRPEDGKKTLLYDDPDYDIDYTYSDWGALVSADHKKLVAFRYQADLPQWIVVDKDAPEAGMLGTLQDAFQGQSVVITSMTNDGNLAVAYVWSDRNPGEYYLYDVKAAKVQYLFSVMSDIKSDDMAEMRPISFHARDGQLIHGYLTLPKGKSKGLPLIVHPHGGPFGIRDEWGFDPEVQYLAYHGYAVLQVEYRGSGGYGYSFEQAGFRQWGGKMQDDITDGVRWAVAQGTVDANRVCIFGASAGGYAAIEAVIKEPDLYKCAAGYAGIYDLERWHDSVGVMYDRLAIPFMQATVGDDEDAMKADSPIYHVDKIKAALFLAHGGEDHVVPPKHADELRDALDKAGKHYEWLYYPKEQHGFWLPEHKVEFYDKLLAFFDKYIGPAAASH